MRGAVNRSMHWAVALACIVGANALARADDSASLSSSITLSGVNGEQIYGQICQGCHMPNGQGAVGAGHYPQLAGDTALLSWQYVALTVLNGRHGMPGFGLPLQQTEETLTIRLTDAQIADTVNYVRSHFGNRFKANVTAKQVAELPHQGVPAKP